MSDSSEAAPYWLVYAMAQRLEPMQCDSYDDGYTCRHQGLCVTEWCAICAAQAWLWDNRKRCELPTTSDQAGE